MTFIKIIKHSVYFFFFVLFLNCLALDGQSPVSTRLSTDFPLNSLFSTGVSIYSEAYNAELNILAITVKNRIFIWNGYSTMEFICKGNAFIDICTSGKVYFATNSQLGFIDGILTGKPALHSLTEILPMN